MVEVTGTVKAREVYEGTMQTVLIRPKVVVTEAAERSVTGMPG